MERVNCVWRGLTVYGEGDQYHAVYGLEEDGAMYTTERVNSVWRG